MKPPEASKPAHLGDETAERLATLWRAGMGAYLDGRPRADCPYQYQSIEAVYWEWGWEWCAQDDHDPLIFNPYHHPELMKWWWERWQTGSDKKPPFPLSPLVVRCPVLGNISEIGCSAYQTTALSQDTRLFMQVNRACRSGCPHSKLAREY